MQLKKDIDAVKTVLDVSKQVLGGVPGADKAKAELLKVLETIYSRYTAQIITRYAMEIAIRKVKDDGIRKQIAKETDYQFGVLSELCGLT